MDGWDCKNPLAAGRLCMVRYIGIVLSYYAEQFAKRG